MTGVLFGHAISLFSLFTDGRWASHLTFVYSWIKFDGGVFKKLTYFLVLKDMALTQFHNTSPKAKETVLQGIW